MKSVKINFQNVFITIDKESLKGSSIYVDNIQ